MTFWVDTRSIDPASTAVRTLQSYTVPIAGWTVQWTYTNGQTISQIWNGQLTTSGAAVTVRNVGYNGSIAPNATRTFGFLGSWNNSENPIPSLTCTAT